MINDDNVVIISPRQLNCDMSWDRLMHEANLLAGYDRFALFEDAGYIFSCKKGSRLQYYYINISNDEYSSKSKQYFIDAIFLEYKLKNE